MIAKIINKNLIHIYDKTQFDVDAIMHSGQVFRYFKGSNGYKLVSGANYAKIITEDDKIIIDCNDSKYWYNYFDLQTDYNKIKNELGVFTKLSTAITIGGGIRILRGEFYEVVISFIISANNNIKRFTKTLNLMAERYGDKLQNNLFAFPTIKQLTKITQDDFRSMGCGYRSAYLTKAVLQLQDINYEFLNKLPTKEQNNMLLKICGVGPKVASCIQLYSTLHRMECAPVDTWIKKAMQQLGECDAKKIMNHKYAGVAQQYIFYYLQHLKKDLN